MSTDPQNLEETRISGETVFDGRVLHVVRDRVMLPDGRESVREVVRHIGAAAVLPMTADRKVFLVRQFRYPFAEPLLEIPAGKRDSFTEDPIETAKRELREEIGAVAGKLTPLGRFYSSPAILDEVIWLYLAEDLTFEGQHLDDGEFLEPLTYEFDDLVQMVLRGKIPDGKTQTAILRVKGILEERQTSGR